MKTLHSSAIAETSQPRVSSENTKAFANRVRKNAASLLLIPAVVLGALALSVPATAQQIPAEAFVKGPFPVEFELGPDDRSAQFSSSDGGTSFEASIRRVK